jgi:hypothetical protein
MVPVPPWVVQVVPQTVHLALVESVSMVVIIHSTVMVAMEELPTLMAPPVGMAVVRVVRPARVPVCNLVVPVVTGQVVVAVAQTPVIRIMGMLKAVGVVVVAASASAGDLLKYN